MVSFVRNFAPSHTISSQRAWDSTRYAVVLTCDQWPYMHTLRAGQEQRAKDGASILTCNGLAAVTDRRWEDASPLYSEHPDTTAVPPPQPPPHKSKRVADKEHQADLDARAERLLAQCERTSKWMSPFNRLVYLRDQATKFINSSNATQIGRDIVYGTGTIRYEKDQRTTYDRDLNVLAKKVKPQGGILNLGDGDKLPKFSCGRVFTLGEEQEQRVRQALANGTSATGTALKVATEKLPKLDEAAKLARLDERKARKDSDAILRQHEAAERAVCNASPSTADADMTALKQHLVTTKKAFNRAQGRPHETSCDRRQGTQEVGHRESQDCQSHQGPDQPKEGESASHSPCCRPVRGRGRPRRCRGTG